MTSTAARLAGVLAATAIFSSILFTLAPGVSARSHRGKRPPANYRAAPPVPAPALDPDEIPPGLVGLLSEQERAARRGRRSPSRQIDQIACTGFVVGSDEGQRIVTARHCLKADTSVRIFDGSETAAAAGAVISGGGADVALVEPEAGASFPEIPIGDSDELARGDQLCAWRLRTDGRELTWDRSCGRFLGRRVVDAGEGAHSMLLMSHALEPGFSGGPVLDAAGRVVGIGVAMTDAGYDLVEPIESAGALALANR